MNSNNFREVNPLEILANFENENININPDDNIIDIYFELFLKVAEKLGNETFLKGNVLLNKIFPETARSTKDLDFSILKEELYYTTIKPILEYFGITLVKNNLADYYEIKELTTNKSGGIKIKDSRRRTLYEVDVSLHKESLFGIIEYNFDGKYINGSKIEKILADKCLSTLSIKRFRRIKDFYDLYIILNSKIKYDIKVVVDLMIEKIGREEILILLKNYPFTEEVITKAIQAWNKLYLKNAITNESLLKPPFFDVLTLVYELYSNIGKVLGDLK